MATQTVDQTLQGEVDGAYFGGHVRPANRKKDRINLRRVQHRAGKRRVVRRHARVSNGAKYLGVKVVALNAAVSKDWKGYWQRAKK